MLDIARIYWFWGLSGSGKTTIANKLSEYFTHLGRECERLDGDLVREFLTKDLGFSIEDRFKHIRRVAYVAKMLHKHGVNVVCSFITPIRAMRIFLKDYLGEDLVLIKCMCSLETCIKRDVKGLYEKALYGEIGQMTGLTSPFNEFCGKTDVILNTEVKSVNRTFGVLLSNLESESLIEVI